MYVGYGGICPGTSPKRDTLRKFPNAKMKKEGDEYFILDGSRVLARTRNAATAWAQAAKERP